MNIREHRYKNILYLTNCSNIFPNLKHIKQLWTNNIAKLSGIFRNAIFVLSLPGTFHSKVMKYMSIENTSIFIGQALYWCFSQFAGKENVPYPSFEICKENWKWSERSSFFDSSTSKPPVSSVKGPIIFVIIIIIGGSILYTQGSTRTCDIWSRAQCITTGLPHLPRSKLLYHNSRPTFDI